MQMRQWLYEAKSSKKRAAQLRADALECERKGFSSFAAAAMDMAALLDPPPRAPRVANGGRQRTERAPGVKPITPRKMGSDPSRVNGQRDAPPLASRKERVARVLSHAHPAQRAIVNTPVRMALGVHR